MNQGKRKLLSSFLILSSILVFAQQNITLPDVIVVEDSIKSAPEYSGSTSREADLLHMDLEIKPDWKAHDVKGKADIYLKAIFAPIDSIHLDAKEYKIHHVAVVTGGVKNEAAYRYDGAMLHIALGRFYTKDEAIHLFVDYTAQPDSVKGRDGRAIRKGKGFYFIDSTAEYSKSFWTQGEPESNSCWFPTIDKPYEKFTHQIGITVDSSYQTLSNGLLEFRTQNGDGTKTDYWKMDMPHAPYLVMVAAGDFDTTSTRWNGKLVRYYVEPKWKTSAVDIFEHTPEMLTLFSDLLNVPYPWQKYDQIVVRDYVSGAMENTTAVVHGTGVYRDERSLADATSEDVIAHELFHQWFGDIVTCKTWGDVTLNEGFASYGEYLWHENKYGKDDVDYYVYREWNQYLREYSRGKSVPLIRLEYDDPDDMFDSHSYNKGGLTLCMLRALVGDEAFFASLTNYLNINAYQAVELSDLRDAFEKTTGQDLRWFFDQWYKVAGHPKINISHSFDKEKGLAILHVEQTQDMLQFPVYRLPVEVEVYTRTGNQRYKIVVDKQKQDFEFPVQSQPQLVKFDVENVLVADVHVDQSEAFWLYQLGNSKNVIDRYKAVEHLLETKNPNLLSTIAGIAMDDSFWAVQLLGLNSAGRWDENGKKKLKETVKKLLESENTRVRAGAIDVWSGIYQENDSELYMRNLDYISYTVNGAALNALVKADATKAMPVAIKGLESDNSSWAVSCGEVIAQAGTAQEVSAADSIFKTKSSWARLRFYVSLTDNISRGGDVGKKMVDILADAALNDPSRTIVYYAPRLLQQSADAMEESSKTAEKTEAEALRAMVKYISTKTEAPSEK